MLLRPNMCREGLCCAIADMRMCMTSASLDQVVLRLSLVCLYFFSQPGVTNGLVRWRLSKQDTHLPGWCTALTLASAMRA